MLSEEIVVSPVAGGWMVESSAGLAPLMFRSGARAEAKAEALARAVAAAGVDVKVVVRDLAGRLAGTKRFWAALQSDLDPVRARSEFVAA